MSAVRALAPQRRLELPVKLLPILQPRRFKVMHGGRGGAKSHTVAEILLMRGTRESLRIVCVRQIQKSLADSSMQVIKDYIEKLDLKAYYEELKTEIRSRINGTRFTFQGLQDHTANAIKSLEGADIVWVEEAANVTVNSWTVLIPTVRKSGSEIWITFNPDLPTDYVYDRFVKKTDADAWVCEINWRDNPWFGSEMDTERRKLKALNDDLYQHVWEGKCRSAAGLLFKRHWFKRFDLGQEPKALNKYLASDYAGEPDADNPLSEPDWSEHGVFGLDSAEHIWITDWWSGQESPDTWIKAWLALARAHKILMAFEEKGVILRTLNGTINKMMRESKTYVHREGLASSGSKYDRALAFAALAATGIVHIPNTPWGDRLIEQLCAFNGQDGRTDDMVDACSKFAQGLDDVIGAAKAPDDDKPKGPAPFTGDWLERLDHADAEQQARQERYYR